jgi:hypothetical protein
MTGYPATRYLHHPAAIRATAADLHANLQAVADYLAAVSGPGRSVPAELARRLDVITDAVLVAERLVAELAAEVTS